MKHFLAFLFALLFISSAVAEPVPGFDPESFYSDMEYEYIRYGDSGLPLADLFVLIGATDYVLNSDEEPRFDDYVFESLLAYQAQCDLPETGYFDFETLCYILSPSVEGDYGILEMTDIVWVPMHGGKKHHKKPECSSMHEPRQMPRDCAIEMGFDPCKRCFKNMF